MLRCSGQRAVGETSSAIEAENMGWYAQFGNHIKDCFFCLLETLSYENRSTNIQKDTLKSGRGDESKCCVLVKRTTENRSLVEGC